MKKTLRFLSCLMVIMLLVPIGIAQEEKNIQDILPEGEKPVLRQLNINIAQDYNTYPVAGVIEEYTDYKVEYDMLPADNAKDKLNMIIASEEPYDIIVYSGDINAVMTYAKAGALMDLNPWLDYAPNLKAAINDYERSIFTIGDSLYAIGMQAPAFGGAGGAVNETVFFRQDYLDALSVQMPKTTDELTEVLRALKGFKNPNGGETIPLTMTGKQVAFSTITGAFGIPNAWNLAEDGTLINRMADPRMKDYLAYMKGLYQEGLLDVEFPANQSSNVYEKFSTGAAGSAYLSVYGYETFGNSMVELQPNAKIGYMPPLSGPNGDIGLGATVGGMDRIAFIPASCKNIEFVLDFLNKKLTDEAFIDLTIGKEGVHFTVDENGERWPIHPIFMDERGQAVNYFTGRPSVQYAEYWTLRVKKRADVWEGWSTINQSPEFTEHRVVSEVGYAPPFDSGSYSAALNEMFINQCVKIIAGTLEVDSYDAFTKEWLSAGGQELIDDYTAWWAEYSAK